jgi:WD40 repeat protein
MAMTKFTLTAAVLLLLGLAGSGAAYFLRPAAAPRPPLPDSIAQAPKKDDPRPQPRPTERKPLTLKHDGGVRALAYARDGKTLATAGSDGTVILWDPATGKQVRRIKAHKKAVCAVCFSPDGKHLASGDEEGDVRLWEAATGKEVRRFRGDDGEIDSLAFSPDGLTLAAAGRGLGWAIRWEVETGEFRGAWRHDGLKESLTSVTYSPDGKLVVLGGRVCLNEGTNWTTFYLRDAATHKLRVMPIEGPKMGVKHVAQAALCRSPAAFTADSSAWACAFSDHTVQVRDAANGKVRVECKGHTGAVTSLVFLRDGRTLVSAGLDQTVRLWDTATGKEWAVLKDEGKGLSLTLSPDGQTLATATADGTVLLRAVPGK